MRNIFKINQRPTNFSEILIELLKLSYPGQPITEKKIWSFFKNERHRSKKPKVN